MSQKETSTATPWAKLLFVNLAVLALGLVVLELAFGNWVRPDQLNRLNLLKTREIRYDVDGAYETDHTYTVYRRDAYGFRGSYPSLSEIDVLTLGGSTTDQRHIHEGETWQDVLHENFAGDYDGLMKERLDGYRERLTILLDAIREFDAAPILVSQRSMKYKWIGGQIQGAADTEDYDGVAINGVDYYHMLSRLNRLTQQACQPSDYLFIDLAAELDLSEDDFYDYHTNPAGCKKMVVV